MNRTYQDWEYDARNTTKSITKLGNELRDRWDTWKKDAPYATFDECIQAELGITANALRRRNETARRKPSMPNGHTRAEELQPKRIQQIRTTPEERERRQGFAHQLWNEGYSNTVIAEALGVSRDRLETDVKALGLVPHKRSMARADSPVGEFPWRNEDVVDDGTVSTIEQPSFAACETPSAAEAIEDVRTQLALILGSRYRLSLKDRNHLITVLNNALGRLHHGENQIAEDSSQGARVAG